MGYIPRREASLRAISGHRHAQNPLHSELLRRVRGVQPGDAQGSAPVAQPSYESVLRGPFLALPPVNMQKGKDRRKIMPELGKTQQERRAPVERELGQGLRVAWGVDDRCSVGCSMGTSRG